MARSYGANATLAGKLEATYGTAPSGDYESLPFISSSLGSEQGLIESDVLGQGRDPLQPIRDVMRVERDLVVPVDLRSFWFWLELLFGPPATTGAGSQRFSSTTVFASSGAWRRSSSRRMRRLCGRPASWLVPRRVMSVPRYPGARMPVAAAKRSPRPFPPAVGLPRPSLPAPIPRVASSPNRPVLVVEPPGAPDASEPCLTAAAIPDAAFRVPQAPRPVRRPSPWRGVVGRPGRAHRSRRPAT
jgi:hypothetical protein